jgi:ParB family chromosome partitioning protein
VVRRGLGKGLGALIPELEVRAQERVQEAAIVAITPNPYQPRRHFDAERLEELVASIRKHGVLQPLIVRRVGEGYQLVAGERRLRAAEAAGLQTVPVVVREIAEERLLEIALVENLQREDLDPLEEARALQALVERGHSQEEVAALVGKSRPAVANAVRLLQLPEAVQALVASRALSAGHARALVGLPAAEAEALARRAVAEDLRVRDVERLAQQRRPVVRRERVRYPQWEERLQERYGARARITGSAERGRIVLEYRGEGQLERLLEALLDLGEEV